MLTILNQQTAVVDVDSDNSSGSYDADEGEMMGGDTVNDTFDEANNTSDDKDSDAGKATAVEESSSSGRKRRCESSLDQPQDHCILLGSYNTILHLTLILGCCGRCLRKVRSSLDGVRLPCGSVLIRRASCTSIKN